MQLSDSNKTSNKTEIYNLSHEILKMKLFLIFALLSIGNAGLYNVLFKPRVVHWFENFFQGWSFFKVPILDNFQFYKI